MEESTSPRESEELVFDKRAGAESGRFFRDMKGREQGFFFKSATPDPTFLWDEPIADGYHRPTHQQPEALEHGGERFHASDADYGTGTSFMHSVVERPAERPAGSRMRKHAAAPRFGGTSFEKAAFSLDKLKDAGGQALEAGKDIGGKVLDRAARFGGQAVDTLKGSGGGVGESLEGALDSASRSPLGAAAMLGGAGIIGAKAVGGAARGAARGVRRLVRGKPKPPKGLIERGLAGLSHLIRK